MGTGIERKYYLFALRVLYDTTAIILLPVAAVLICRFLFHVRGPLLYLLLVAAFVGTIITFWRKTKTYGEEFEKLSGGNGSARR